MGKIGVGQLGNSFNGILGCHDVWSSPLAVIVEVSVVSSSKDGFLMEVVSDASLGWVNSLQVPSEVATANTLRESGDLMPEQESRPKHLVRRVVDKVSALPHVPEPEFASVPAIYRQRECRASPDLEFSRFGAGCQLYRPVINLYWPFIDFDRISDGESESSRTRTMLTRKRITWSEKSGVQP